MATQKVNFTYGVTTGVITWDGARAEAPIRLDGDSTGFNTADAQHQLRNAVYLVLDKAFGGVDMDDVEYAVVQLSPGERIAQALIAMMEGEVKPTPIPRVSEYEGEQRHRMMQAQRLK